MNTYAYDSANRLSTLTGAATTVGYSYNGLGDRLQETVNGVTTTFTMDLNTGLTQALSDGASTYLYGNPSPSSGQSGRLAQTNAASTEYFLGDALGSVRQLTDSTGAVTLSKIYDPYGVVSQSAGASQSSYGYTGEFQDSYNELVYLRARHYAPSMGRFLSRDTWAGDMNRPPSFNKWNYTYSNSINLTDPTGNDPIAKLQACISHLGENSAPPETDLVGLCYVEAYMRPDSNDYVNTYVAAGVAIESNFYTPLLDSRNGPWWKLRELVKGSEFNEDATALGICNISDRQMETPWGQPTEIDGKKKKGLGLGMSGLNQEDPYVAIAAMRRRILAVIRSQNPNYQCKGCSSTDIFIAAALAEGSNLFPWDIKLLREKYRYKDSNPNEMTLNWHEYIDKLSGNPFHRFRQIRLFYLDVKELLRRDDWAVPDDLNWQQIELLSNGNKPRDE